MSADPNIIDKAKSIIIKLKNLKNLDASKSVIDQDNVLSICEEAMKLIKKDPILLRLEAPVNVIGDIHGQLTDLMKFLYDEHDKSEKDEIDFLSDENERTKYLFLGDYVDRGPSSVEVFTFLLCFKILHTKRIYLLRGNHETQRISTLYGLKDEISVKYHNPTIYDKFIEVFNYLPLAAIITDRIFCVHGGISKNLVDVKSIELLDRPLDVSNKSEEEKDFVQDLLWADPSPDASGYTPSERGASFTFGCDAADKFLALNNYELICRAHQVVDNGYDFPFFPKQNVITIFSAPNYCNEFNNKGAMLVIDPVLSCSFKIVDSDNPNYNSWLLIINN